ERVQAAVEGRRLPEDDEAFAVVEGTLRADAAQTDSGVSLSMDVGAVAGQVGQAGQAGQAGRVAEQTERSASLSGERVRRAPLLGGPSLGGIVVTVVGSLAADRIDDWRAGRRVRLPVQLRRPSRYLDPGVPDHERALARRGTTLVGSVKSGALVQVVARGRWFEEAMSAAGAFSRPPT